MNFIHLGRLFGSSSSPAEAVAAKFAKQIKMECQLNMGVTKMRDPQYRPQIAGLPRIRTTIRYPYFRKPH